MEFDNHILRTQIAHSSYLIWIDVAEDKVDHGNSPETESNWIVLKMILKIIHNELIQFYTSKARGTINNIKCVHV